jgi:TonB family protein
MIRAATRWIAGASLLAAVCTLPWVRAQTPPEAPSAIAAEAVPLAAFRDPRPVSYPMPNFPGAEREPLHEGWAVVSMMVDKAGRPYEVGIVRSTGNRTIDRVAVRAWQDARFVPATSDGKPVDSVFEMRYTFVISGLLEGARPEFHRAYSSMRSAVQSGNREAADAALRQLSVTTLYEDAYYGLAQYMYASAWGDQSRLESGLLRAVGGRQYLPPAEREPALLAAFQLQVRRHDYHEALELWKQLQAEHVDQDTQTKLRPIIAQIKSVRTAPGGYTMSGSIEDIGSWNVYLFKRSFTVQAPAGAISLVKLRCQGGLVSFAFDPELTYKVPERYGGCRLTLEGTPGTALVLTQS